MNEFFILAIVIPLITALIPVGIVIFKYFYNVNNEPINIIIVVRNSFTNFFNTENN